MTASDTDQHYMREAVRLARQAADVGEVPIGAVIVDAAGSIIATAHNRRELDGDPTAHAEVLAIRQAAAARGGWRLSGCTLYVTIEPCPMCAGAIVLARIARLVFGARDPKAGACGTLMDIVRDSRLNHRVEVVGGVLASECATVMQDFFAKRR